jgi:fatty-acyl-CoA synthase
MNVGNWIAKRARLYPGRPFLKEDEGQFDNAHFNTRVNRTAHGLRSLGVSVGERVAVLMENSSAFLEVFFACAKIGAVCVPVNTHLAASEMAHIMSDAAPLVMVYSASLQAKALGLAPALDARAVRLVHGHGASGADRSLEALAARQPEGEPSADAALGLDAALMIMYTSGTTGTPKGAVLTHGNFLFGAIHSLLSYHLDERCRSLVVAPLFHIGALAASVTPVIYAGGSLVLKSFDNPSDVLATIEQEKISFMFAVPVMYEMMAKAPRWAASDFASVDFFIAGGAPMPVPLIRRYQEEKGIPFAQGYGMTETLRITALDLEAAERKAGSIGKEVFHTTLAIRDESGRELAAEETGEIVVKGPTVFQGYWGKPQASEAVLQDGWFHTGDLGRRDAEGFIYLVGRKNDLIICAGENIYAAEVERAIEAHPRVAEAAVVGIPDKKRGEVPAAFIRLEDDEPLREEDLLRHLEDQLAAFKFPRKIRFVRDFPRNRTGKILKQKLKERLDQENRR